MPRTATAEQVSREQLPAFLRPRHHALLMTSRRDARPQLSPVSAGVDAEGQAVVATYPQRAKVTSARREPRVSPCCLSDDWDGPWVRVDPYRSMRVRVTVQSWGPVATGGFPPDLQPAP